jgi:hypothetical protein
MNLYPTSPACPPHLFAGGIEGFSETAEFVRSIQPLAPKAEDTASYMDVDEQPAAAAATDADMLPRPSDSKPPLAPKQPRKYRKGGWAPAADDEVSCCHSRVQKGCMRMDEVTTLHPA